MGNKKQWNKVYCKNCKKYLGRLAPEVAFCTYKCQAKYYNKEDKNEKLK